MGVRRVVTGHSPQNKSVVVNDGELDIIPVGALGSAVIPVWGFDAPPEFPDDGTQPPMVNGFPPPGGCACAVWELAPEGDDFHEFVANALAPWADQEDRGM